MKRLLLVIFALLAVSIFDSVVYAAQTDLTGPAGSGTFGQSVTVLPSGNIVVTDPLFDAPGGITDAGAVYLYNGATLALISTLTGSTAGDQVGNGGIVGLSNDNYVVLSPNWDNGAIANVGAATFCNGTTGVNGTISASNSLVGATANDSVGNNAVALTNGNYVVLSPGWDNGAITNVGAATFAGGATGIVGTISASNSLIGSTASDLVGNSGIIPLTNGNYVVRSPNWDSSAIVDAGAVTFGSGTTGASGAISASNSLVGASASDVAGGGGVTALANGNYVVLSPSWDSGAIVDVGAVTFGNGTSGVSGAISASNSLVGATANDIVGSISVTVLTNGNYVVRAPNWDNGATADAGAATFGNGTTGVSGIISASNSLIGSSANDLVSISGATALANGNYVVRSSSWDNGAIANVGAATFGSGITGVSGTISAANSLIGSTAGDSVSNVVALTNGNYVVGSPDWDNGALANAGAVTFGNGVTGVSGVVSTVNSLVGSTTADSVGGGGIFALTNGNYVVSSSTWHNGAINGAGAATFGNGVTGISGTISTSNSLVGSSPLDSVSNNGVVALTNGNYVVLSPSWDNSTIADGGAATFGNGTTGISGAVSASNSLVGSQANDVVGGGGVTALTNGNYVVRNPAWDNSALINAGAVTFGSGTTGISGAVSASNSLVGSSANDRISSINNIALSNGNYIVRSPNWDNGAITDAGAYTFGNGATGTVGAITSGTTGGNSVVGTVTSGTVVSVFDATRNRLVVGRVASNTVSILSFTTTATTNGDVGNAANFSNGAPNALVSAIIPSGRAMTISSKINAGLIQVQCGGNLTGGSASAYVIGSVRRDFCAAANESFTYPLGDANVYTPLTVSNTNGTGALTAAVTDNFMTGLGQAKSLSRYWSLTGAGITTNLTFSYIDADVNGTEAFYIVYKRSGATNLTVPVNPSSVNAAANTFTATNVSQFSDWSAGELAFVPTAAVAAISGRVLTPAGSRYSGATVYLTTMSGATQRTETGRGGDFQFEEVEVGQTVILTVVSKRFTYATQLVTVTGDLSGMNFTPVP